MNTSKIIFLLKEIIILFLTELLMSQTLKWMTMERMKAMKMNSELSISLFFISLWNIIVV